MVPKPEDLQRAADVLNAGTKVAMLVGPGALGAPDEIIRVASTFCGRRQRPKSKNQN